MDFQVAFNLAVGLAAFLGGWVLNSLKQSIDNLQRQDQALADKVQHIEVLVAGQYVKRDDFDRVCNKIFDKLDKLGTEQAIGLDGIRQQLNGKADRHHRGPDA